ncbi:MAG: hypothetical protein PVF43_17100 [Candidatus Eiseniibacteriota bacterium]
MESNESLAPYASLSDYGDLFTQPTGPPRRGCEAGDVRVPPRHAGLVEDPTSGPAAAAPVTGQGAGAGTGQIARRSDGQNTHAVGAAIDRLIDGIDSLSRGAIDARRQDEVAALRALRDRTLALRQLVEHLLPGDASHRDTLQTGHRPVDMGSMLHRAIRTCAPTAATRAIRPQLQVPDDVPLVQADPHRIEQLVTSLTTCLIQSSGEGSTVRLGIDLCAGHLDTWIRTDGLLPEARWIDRLVMQTVGTAAHDHDGCCCGAHGDCGQPADEHDPPTAITGWPAVETAIELARELAAQQAGRLVAERPDDGACVLHIELPLP